MMLVVRRVFHLFVQPKRLFQELLEQPDVLAPLLLLLISGFLRLYTLNPQAAALLHSRLATAEGGVVANDRSDVLYGVFMVVLFAGTALASLLSLFVNSLLLTGLCRVVGIGLSLSTIASMVAYCQLPLALRNAVYAGYDLATHSLLPSLHLNSLIPVTSGMVHTTLQHFDLFVLWSYVLLGVGLAVASGGRQGRAWAVLALFVVTNGLLNFLFSYFPTGGRL